MQRRILIFNVNWLGDVLFSTAVIRNIKRNFPGSFLACVIPSRCYPVVKGNPYLDEVIIFDEKDRHKGLLAKLDFVSQLRDKKFDTVFLLHRSLTRALLCRLAGIAQRIGYHTQKRAFLLTKNIPMPAKDSLHRIDYYLNVIEKAGLRVEDRFPEFFFSEIDERFVADFLRKQGVSPGEYLVVINCGGNWLPKRWPKLHWALLADTLIRELKVKVLISGSTSDVPLAKEISRAMREKLFIACGGLTLNQVGALCKRADVFISADSGPLHIANASGAKKIIGLFGPTSIELTGPYPLTHVTLLQKNVGCKIPCYKIRCQDNQCMKAITPQEVFEQVKRICHR